MYDYMKACINTAVGFRQLSGGCSKHADFFGMLKRGEKNNVAPCQYVLFHTG